MPDPTNWIRVIRSSHDRFSALVTPLSGEQVRGPSYADEWSIAQVASHLGSQAEIFALFLDAGLNGSTAPGREAFGPIWDRWNALDPVEQVSQSIAANERLVGRLEQTTPDQQQRFSLPMFGSDVDLAGMAAMRLAEHALHTWDVAVMFDPDATVAFDAVELLVDTVEQTAARAGKRVQGVGPVAITTNAPDRAFLLTAEPIVSLAARNDSGADPLRLPAEALVRLVAGRLDPAHTGPAVGEDSRLTQLRSVFPGF